nr:MAG TPA: hypothetical protein [Caudoviricetes sp.]
MVKPLAKKFLMGAFFFCKNNDAVLTAVYINKKMEVVT